MSSRTTDTKMCVRCESEMWADEDNRFEPGVCRVCMTLGPRWIDWHFPDQWLLDRLNRVIPKRGRLRKATARYALRHIHCNRDGQCVLRAGHRGGCDWGADDDD